MGASGKNAKRLGIHGDMRRVNFQPSANRLPQQIDSEFDVKLAMKERPFMAMHASQTFSQTNNLNGTVGFGSLDPKLTTSSSYPVNKSIDVVSKNRN